MEKRRTLVFCRHLLFAQGLRTLLDDREGIKVVGIETDEPRAMESIKALKPDIVIVERGEDGVPIDNLLSFLVRESPESRLIGLSLGQNEIDVYYGHHTVVRSAEDLIDVMSHV